MSALEGDWKYIFKQSKAQMKTMFWQIMSFLYTLKAIKYL